MITTDIFRSPSLTASSRSKHESTDLEKDVVSKDKEGTPTEILLVDEDEGCPDGGLRAWLVVLGVRRLLNCRQSYETDLCAHSFSAGWSP